MTTSAVEEDPKADRMGSSARWPLIPLGEIADVKLGKMLDKAKHLSGRRLPYLRNVNVRWGSVDTDDLREMNFEDDELERFGLTAGDVLVCEGGEPGRAAVWNGHRAEMKFQKAIHRVRFKRAFEPRLLVYYLELLAKSGGLERRFTGSTIKHFTREAFVQLPIPLPPLPEQRRIVAEIEKQFTRLDAGIAALRRTQANLKRYRAAVLKAACEGHLVPTEFAWPQKQIATAIQTMDQGWSPKCESEPSCSNATWAVIKTTAIQNLRFLEGENKALPSALPPREHLELGAGDLLVTRAGPRNRVGVACLVKNTRPRLMLCDKAYRLRTKPNIAQPAFIELVLNAPHVVDEVNKLKTGISDSGVNLTQQRFRELVIPLPPLAEQTRIVEEVERRLSVVEELEWVVNADLQRATRLRQSVLQHAFTPPANCKVTP